MKYTFDIEKRETWLEYIGPFMIRLALLLFAFMPWIILVFLFLWGNLLDLLIDGLNTVIGHTSTLCFDLAYQSTISFKDWAYMIGLFIADTLPIPFLVTVLWYSTFELSGKRYIIPMMRDFFRERQKGEKIEKWKYIPLVLFYPLIWLAFKLSLTGNKQSDLVRPAVDIHSLNEKCSVFLNTLKQKQDKAEQIAFGIVLKDYLTERRETLHLSEISHFLPTFADVVSHPNASIELMLASYQQLRHQETDEYYNYDIILDECLNVVNGYEWKDCL